MDPSPEFLPKEKSILKESSKSTESMAKLSTKTKNTEKGKAIPHAVTGTLPRKKAKKQGSEALIMKTVKAVMAQMKVQTNAFSSQIKAQTEALTSISVNLCDRPAAAEETKKMGGAMLAVWQNLSSQTTDEDEVPELTEFSKSLLSQSKSVEIDLMFARAFRKAQLQTDLSGGFMQAIAKSRLKWDSADWPNNLTIFNVGPKDDWDSRTHTSCSLAAIIAADNGFEKITTAEAKKLASQRVTFPTTVDGMLKHFKAYAFLLKLLFGESSILATAMHNLLLFVKRHRNRITEIHRNRKFALLNFMFAVDRRVMEFVQSCEIEDRGYIEFILLNFDSQIQHTNDGISQKCSLLL